MTRKDTGWKSSHPLQRIYCTSILLRRTRPRFHKALAKIPIPLRQVSATKALSNRSKFFRAKKVNTRFLEIARGGLPCVAYCVFSFFGGAEEEFIFKQSFFWSGLRWTIYAPIMTVQWYRVPEMLTKWFLGTRKPMRWTGCPRSQHGAPKPDTRLRRVPIIMFPTSKGPFTPQLLLADWRSGRSQSEYWEKNCAIIQDKCLQSNNVNQSLQHAAPWRPRCSKYVDQLQAQARTRSQKWSASGFPSKVSPTKPKSRVKIAQWWNGYHSR